MAAREVVREDVKLPYLLTLIGAIVGISLSLLSFMAYFLFRSFSMMGNAGMMASSPYPFEIFSYMAVWIFISSILGLVLGVVLVVLAVKVKANPSRNLFIAITALSAIGLFSGLGIGGIVSLVGGIIGITRTS